MNAEIIFERSLDYVRSKARKMESHEIVAMLWEQLEVAHKEIVRLNVGPRTMSAKWLDPKCWDGCQSLVFKKERDEAIKDRDEALRQRDEAVTCSITSGKILDAISITGYLSKSMLDGESPVAWVKRMIAERDEVKEKLKWALESNSKYEREFLELDQKIRELEAARQIAQSNYDLISESHGNMMKDLTVFREKIRQLINSMMKDLTVLREEIRQLINSRAEQHI